MVSEAEFPELIRATAKEIQERCAKGFDGIKFNGYGNCMVAKIDGILEAANLLRKAGMEKIAYRLEDLAGEVRGLI